MATVDFGGTTLTSGMWIDEATEITASALNAVYTDTSTNHVLRMNADGTHWISTDVAGAPTPEPDPEPLDNFGEFLLYKYNKEVRRDVRS